MSRIGRLPVAIPDKVEVKISGPAVAVKGPKGSLSWNIPAPIVGRVEGSSVTFTRPDDERQNKALHGLCRALVANMVTGVSAGFTKVLEIQGTGYRANVQGNTLNLDLGFSHPVKFEIPKSMQATVERNVVITLTGIDKELVGEVAAKIRGIRPAEPYKGKGVRYQGEYIRRKVGKKNV